MRKAIRTAGYDGTAAFFVYTALLGRCYGDTATVQVTWRTLQKTLGGMPWQTFSDALAHLERHGWLTRERTAGHGRPTVYTLHLGLACQCRPGRGHPATSAERMRKLRARRQTTGVVTLTQDKDEPGDEPSDVTVSLDKDVTANRDKGCDAQPEQRWPGCDTDERHIPQVRGHFSPYMYVSPGKSTETTTGGSVNDTPETASPDVTVSQDKGAGVATPRTAIPPIGATLPELGDDGDSPADPNSHPRSRSDDYPPAGPSLLADARRDTERDLDPRASWGYVETGPCAICRQPCHRYGDGGRPLCDTCDTVHRSA